jgi:hypothetical protein
MAIRLTAVFLIETVKTINDTPELAEKTNKRVQQNSTT